MADFTPALNFVLDSEDSQRSYAIVSDPGGYAIAGVNSAVWPTCYQIIAELPQGQRGPAVASFYQTNFWSIMRLSGLASQDLANRVLDEGVNAGEYTACRMLQQVANGLNLGNGSLVVDGILGPQSLESINGLPAEDVLNAYRQARLARYKQIAIEIPSRAGDLPGWTARALR